MQRTAWTLSTALAGLITLSGCASHQTELPSHPISQSVPTRNDSALIHPRAVEVKKTLLLGRSVDGAPIECLHFPSSTPGQSSILLFAGIHGDEQSTVGVMRRFVEELTSTTPRLDVDLYVIPLANPDGYAAKTRTNANKVDLNRNFPAVNWKTSQRKTQYWNGPAPLSEPESRALHDLVLKLKPIRILSMHSIKAGRHGNNYDGPAEFLAALLASKNQYNVLPTMGYPTPGSFGSWAGIDLNIPTITLELPSNVSSDTAWKQNRDALWAFVRGK